MILLDSEQMNFEKTNSMISVFIFIKIPAEVTEYSGEYSEPNPIPNIEFFTK